MWDVLERVGFFPWRFYCVGGFVVVPRCVTAIRVVVPVSQYSIWFGKDDDNTVGVFRFHYQ